MLDVARVGAIVLIFLGPFAWLIAGAVSEWREIRGASSRGS